MALSRLRLGGARLGLAALLLLAAAPGRARADDEALALLRAASTESAIIVFCGKYHALDGTTALKISQTSREVAAKVMGRDRAEAAYKEALAERYAEVKETGEAQWCAEQRAAMKADGVGIFKD